MQCRIFVNYFEILKLYITQPGGNILKAFKRYSELLESGEGSLKQTGERFAWTSKYGFLSCSPENIGAGLELQVMLCDESLTSP